MRFEKILDQRESVSEPNKSNPLGIPLSMMPTMMMMKNDVMIDRMIEDAAAAVYPLFPSIFSLSILLKSYFPYLNCSI